MFNTFLQVNILNDIYKVSFNTLPQLYMYTGTESTVRVRHMHTLYIFILAHTYI